MDQNQSVDNDLQKAIDNITNTTNDDPVFSDPVAAPSSIPEGDTGELSSPVGPFPEPKVEMVTPAPEPIAPLESMNIPELNNPNLVPPTEPMTPTTDPQPESTPETTLETDPENHQDLKTDEIKKAALRDLAPLLDKVSMDAPQKFKIYQDIFKDLQDYSVLEPALNAAREIGDEKERAEALLYLVESIDKM